MGHARPHEGGSVSDRPDARELVEEVAAWLAGVLAPELDAGPRFQALVAAQGLAIAARDMQRAAADDLADVAELGAVLGAYVPADATAVRRALASSLRCGAFEDRLDDVASALNQHVRRKLARARPGYDA